MDRRTSPMRLAIRPARAMSVTCTQCPLGKRDTSGEEREERVKAKRRQCPLTRTKSGPGADARTLSC
jgi:hypothetical protein